MMVAWGDGKIGCAKWWIYEHILDNESIEFLVYWTWGPVEGNKLILSFLTWAIEEI